MKRKCETCRFWERIEPGYFSEYESGLVTLTGDEVAKGDPKSVIVGECRRYPPQLVSLAIKETIDKIEARHNLTLDTHSFAPMHDGSRWPLTAFDDWCGEWQRQSKSKKS